MDKPSESTRNLARRLLAFEALRRTNGQHEAVIVCEKLRVSLTRFAGAEGFAALMRRSLGLSRADVPALAKVTLRADGCFVGLEEAAGGGDGSEAGAVLTAHLLWLLVTFVGEPVTFRLVREAWPDLSSDV